MTEQSWTIGTGTPVQPADIALPPGQGVAQQHARLIFNGTTIVVEEVSAAAPVKLAGGLHVQRAVVAQNDVLHLGPTVTLTIADCFEWEGDKPIRFKHPMDFSKQFLELVLFFIEYREAKRKIANGNNAELLLTLNPIMNAIGRKIIGKNRAKALETLEESYKNTFVCPKCRQPMTTLYGYTEKLLRETTECPRRCGAKWTVPLTPASPSA